MTETVTNSSVLMDDVTTAEYDLPTTMEDSLNFESIINKTTNEYLQSHNVTQEDQHYAVFEAFNIMEIIMTAVELMVWIVAAIAMPRWRRNYRNQMLIQLSVARFIKRVIFSFKFLQENHQLTSWGYVKEAIDTSTMYIDFVIVVLVFFFIKHMYDSLIIVVVKVKQTSLYKVSLCSWLGPVPVSAVWTAIIVSDTLDRRAVYLLICCIFRWPLILIGTIVYLCILYRVLFDKIRRFARSLTTVTFFMCLTINFYLFSKDVIDLWCFHSFNTKLISHVSGLIMNFLILCLYVVLITLDYKHCSQTPKSLNSIPNYSLADTCCKISNLNDYDD